MSSADTFCALLAAALVVALLSCSDLLDTWALLP